MNKYLAAAKDALDAASFRRWEPHLTDAAILVAKQIELRNQGKDRQADEIGAALTSMLGSIDLAIREKAIAAIRAQVEQIAKGVLALIV